VIFNRSNDYTHTGAISGAGSLVKEGSGVGANVLKNLDVDLRKVRLEVEKLVKSGPDMAGPTRPPPAGC